MKVFKRNLCKVVASILIVIQVVLLCENATYAYSDGRRGEKREQIISSEEPMSDDVLEEVEENRQKEHELEVKLYSTRYSSKEKVKLEFDKSEIKDYYYVTDGVSVSNEAERAMELEVDNESGFGSIDIYAEYEDGETTKSSVYTYKEDDKVYVSDISKDSAWHECMEDRYNKGLITKEEWDNAYSELAQSYIEEVEIEEEISDEDYGIALMSSAAPTVVKGTLSWQLADGTILALKQTKVELRDDEAIGSRVIATTYTDNNGNYSFTFANEDDWYDWENGGLDVFIRWYSETYTFDVNQSFVFEYNYFDSKVVDNVASGTTTRFNYYIKYDESLNLNKFFYVQQGMIVGQRFAEAMGMSTDNYIHVIYPAEAFIGTDTAFCWGEVWDNCFAAIGKNKYKDIDTLIHEYGHFVEVSMGNYGADLWEIIMNNPNHTVKADHFVDKEDKEYAMELTWSEAWATVFSQLAQSYYKSEYIKINGFADAKDRTFDVENVSVEANSGEAQEYAVIGMLWDLYDSSSSESFDKLALGYKNWWNYTTRRGTYTLTDFANVVERFYLGNRGAVGEIMAKHQISPGNLTITNKSSVSTTTAPTLTWRVNGSKSNPNNRFQVAFFDNYGNYIYLSPYISSTQAYNTTYKYTVPQSIWNQVVKNYCGTYTINIAVRAYNTKDFVSGPYTSKYAPVTLTVHSTVSISSGNRYTEKVIKLDKGGYYDYTVTFGSAGYKLIQTFGTNDTKIEIYSSSGTLLASDDDGGYGSNALKKYYFSANTKYKIRVKFYNVSKYGMTKLAITPAYGALNSGCSDLKKYEDIFAMTNCTKCAWTTYMYKNCTRVMTFTPPSTGKYTFTIASSFDSYIYVIDPRSSSALSSSMNYNDDSGEGSNPLLTTTLTANVPYLIIYSAYNPSTLTATMRLTLNINKN